MSSFLCSYHMATLPKTSWSNFTKVLKYNLLTATKAQICSDKKYNIHLKDGHHKEVWEWAVSRNGNERWLLDLLPRLLTRLSPLSYQVVVFRLASGFLTFPYLEGYVYLFTPFVLKCLLCHIGDWPGGKSVHGPLKSRKQIHFLLSISW